MITHHSAQYEQATKAHIIGYRVTDSYRQQSKRFKTRKAAMEFADRRDHQYGAVCCGIRAVWSDDPCGISA